MGYDRVRTRSGSRNGGGLTTRPIVRPIVLKGGCGSGTQHGRSLQDAAPVLQGSGRYLVHELVFACSPLPPPRLQTSHTILTQADWRAVRAVADQGLLPVITTAGSGSQVFWH